MRHICMVKGSSPARPVPQDSTEPIAPMSVKRIAAMNTMTVRARAKTSGAGIQRSTNRLNGPVMTLSPGHSFVRDVVGVRSDRTGRYVT